MSDWTLAVLALATHGCVAASRGRTWAWGANAASAALLARYSAQIREPGLAALFVAKSLVDLAAACRAWTAGR